MTEQEMMTLLRKKLDRGMAQYRKEWQQKPELFQGLPVPVGVLFPPELV